MSENNTFELVIDGKTYTTKKMTPPLRGRMMTLSGHILKEAEAAGLTYEDLKDPNAYPNWLRVLISGALWIHLPAIMWDFIRPEDKSQIGTQENLDDSLTDEVLGNFHAWAMGRIEAANNLVKKTPEESEPPSIS